LRKCLGLLFTNGSTRQQLHQPLGKWYAPLKSCNWAWYDISSTTTSLYERRGDKWYIYPWRNRSRRRGQLSCLGRELTEFSPFFETLLTTTVELKHNQSFLQGRTNHHHISRQRSCNINKNPLNSSTSWLGSSLSTNGNLAHLKASITNGTAIAASDGSYNANSNQTSAAYALLDSTGQHGLECSMDVPGDASCQNAYGAEVAGILGALFLIQLSRYIFDHSHGNVAVYCDGKSALEQV
jgi:hypothetical protein